VSPFLFYLLADAEALLAISSSSLSRCARRALTRLASFHRPCHAGFSAYNAPTIRLIFIVHNALTFVADLLTYISPLPPRNSPSALLGLLLMSHVARALLQYPVWVV